MIQTGERSLRLWVTCALREEGEVLRAALGDSRPVLTIGMGSGRSRTTLRQALENSDPPKALVFAGTAGALDPDLELGQVVTAKTWRRPSGETAEADPRLLDRVVQAGVRLVPVGLTLNRPVWLTEKRLRWFQQTGASVCDMEAWAVLTMAARFSIPALAVKVVSDTVDCGRDDFYRHFGECMGQLSEELVRIIPALDA